MNVVPKEMLESEEFHELCRQCEVGKITFGNAGEQLGWSADTFTKYFKRAGYVQKRTVQTIDMPDNFHEYAQMVESGKITQRKAAADLKVSPPTFRKWYRQFNYKPFVGQKCKLGPEQKLELAQLFKKHIFPMEAAIMMDVPYYLVENEVKRLMGWK